MSLLADIRTTEHDNGTSPTTPDPTHAELARLLDGIAERIVDHGTLTEAPVLEAMAAVAREVCPGAAAALVDWNGSETARLRAFGIVHGVVLELVGPPSDSLLLDEVRGAVDLALAGERAPAGRTPSARAWHRRHPYHLGASIRANTKQPAVGGPSRRDSSSSCWAGRGSRSTARAGTGSAAGRAGRSWRSCCSANARRRGASWPRCSSPRPTTRCGRCAGAWPRSAEGSGPGGRSTVTRCSSRSRPAPRSTSTSWSHGHWRDAVDLPGLGADLLDGLSIQNAAPSSRGCSPSGVGSRRPPSRSCTRQPWVTSRAGTSSRARDLAVRAAVMSPLDENHQALLIRLYRLAGDDDAAERQFAAWSATAERELGASPGRRGPAGACANGRDRTRRSTRPPIHAITEAGAAAVSAGALGAGVASFETAVRLADQAGAESLRVETRLVLAEALIHTLGGLDEEGVATLTEAERIALAER